MLVFDINVSHGSVATRLMCGGIFHNDFSANLPLSLSVKEFWKSVNIWRSYRQSIVACFFDSQCRCRQNSHQVYAHGKNSERRNRRNLCSLRSWFTHHRTSTNILNTKRNNRRHPHQNVFIHSAASTTHCFQWNITGRRLTVKLSVSISRPTDNNRSSQRDATVDRTVWYLSKRDVGQSLRQRQTRTRISKWTFWSLLASW